MPLTFGFHPEIVPSSVAKMNKAGAELPFWLTTNPLVGLLTWPSGAERVNPGGGVAGAAIETVSATGAPAAVYKVASPTLLSEIQNGLAAPKEMPHGLERFGSTFNAAGRPRLVKLAWSSVVRSVS